MDEAGEWAGESDGSGVNVNIGCGEVLYQYNDFPEYHVLDTAHLTVVDPPHRRTVSWTFTFDREPQPEFPPLPDSIVNFNRLIKLAFWASIN